MEILVVDHPLDIFSNEMTNFRDHFVASDASVIDARPILVELFIRQVQLLLMVLLCCVVKILLIKLIAARIIFDLRKFVIVIIIVTTIIVISSERRVE